MQGAVQTAVAKSGKGAVQGAEQGAVQTAVAKSGKGVVQGAVQVLSRLRWRSLAQVLCRVLCRGAAQGVVQSAVAKSGKGAVQGAVQGCPDCGGEV